MHLDMWLSSFLFKCFRPQVDPRQQWKLTPDGHIASVMLTDLYLTSTCGLRVEIPQDTKGKEDDHNASKSSLSSSSDSESSLEPGGGMYRIEYSFYILAER